MSPQPLSPEAKESYRIQVLSTVEQVINRLTEQQKMLAALITSAPGGSGVEGLTGKLEASHSELSGAVSRLRDSFPTVAPDAVTGETS